MVGGVGQRSVTFEKGSTTYLGQSIPIGRPLMCSGHAPMVKLGAGVVGDILRLVVEPGGDCICCDKLFGDFVGVFGDFIETFIISQVLQSIPFVPMCSGHCCDGWLL